MPQVAKLFTPNRESRISRHVTLEPGETLYIDGFRKPCDNCKGDMNKMTKAAPGSTVVYTWYDDAGDRRGSSKPAQEAG